VALESGVGWISSLALFSVEVDHPSLTVPLLLLVSIKLQRRFNIQDFRRAKVASMRWRKCTGSLQPGNLSP
jgi:hypothetical protein